MRYSLKYTIGVVILLLVGTWLVSISDGFMAASYILVLCSALHIFLFLCNTRFFAIVIPTIILFGASVFVPGDSVMLAEDGFEYRGNELVLPFEHKEPSRKIPKTIRYNKESLPQGWDMTINFSIPNKRELTSAQWEKVLALEDASIEIPVDLLNFSKNLESIKVSLGKWLINQYHFMVFDLDIKYKSP